MAGCFRKRIRVDFLRIKVCQSEKNAIKATTDKKMGQVTSIPLEYISSIIVAEGGETVVIL